MIKLPARVWGHLDQWSHRLYEPTKRRGDQYRWHHRFHLIPGPVCNWICDRYDTSLGLYDESDIEEAA